MASLLAAACIYVLSSAVLVLMLQASMRRWAAADWREGLAQGLKLPPGSLGLPYLGETLQLYSQNPKIFFASRLKK